MDYIHGGDIYGKEIELDFSVNINPLGMPPKSIEAAIEGIHSASRYPDYQCTALREKIAAKKQIDKEKILVGNGAAELIFAICQSIRPKIALAPAPCFGEYERAVNSVGGRMKYVPLCKEDEFEIKESFLSSITDETDLLFLCNPNNPTGKLIPKDFLKAVIKKCEETNTCLLVDECFLPFLSREDEHTLLRKKSSRLIRLRAFTKIYGMAGLRLGYAVFEDVELLRKIRQVLQPWNVSIPAQNAGVAALDDSNYLKRTHQLIEKEKCYLLHEMKQGLADKVYDTSANFIFFEAEPDLAERFLEKKILIRDCSNYPNLEKGYFRICVGNHKENMELIRRWKKLGKGE